MSPSEPWRIGLTGAVLAAALAGLVAWEGRARAEGREVALRMEGIDPRGLLTGAHVRLQLRESLRVGEACPPGTRADGPDETVGRGWVALRRDGAEWRVAGMAFSRADASRLGEVAVRGRASCFTAAGGFVDLDIGIARFHAAQDEAEAMERLLLPGRDAPSSAYALVSVGRDGRARLNGVRLEGRRVELDWF